MKKIFLIAGIVFLILTSLSCTKKNVMKADYQIIPQPQHVSVQAEASPFILNEDVCIVYPEGNQELESSAFLLAGYIKSHIHKEIPVKSHADPDHAILLQISPDGIKPEGYQLEISSKDIVITGNSGAGVFYGIQNLRKSLPVSSAACEVELPAAHIVDYPTFAYRGAHFDVCRHFFTVDEVKTYIDMMALHQMNRLHWHITDDQGWRVKIKKYPRLTEIGSVREETLVGHLNDRPEKYDGTPYKGFYTQEEIKEIVDYAARNYITIIPEVDLPGHMQAALTAYPELGCTGGPYKVWTKWGVSEEVLCAGNPKTLQFLYDVFDEIMELFPSEYIHIGGDECPKVRWEQCPKCQALIRSKGIKSDSKHTKEQYLQTYVMTQVSNYLKQHGRKVIGWDEMLEGSPDPQSVIMSWRGENGGIEAAKQGHDVIMAPNTHMYFDYYQTLETEKEPLSIGGYVPMEKVYSYNPLSGKLTDEQKKHIWGVQANLWTEYIHTFDHVQYMVLPRWSALAEIQWTNPSHRDYKEFLERVGRMMKQYQLEGYNYAKHVLNVNASFRSNSSTGKLEVMLTTLGDAPIYYTLDGTEPTADSPLYTGMFEVDSTCVLQAVAVRPEGNSEIYRQELQFNKATNKPVSLQFPPDDGYKGQGSGTLVDGVSGNTTFGSGKWLGFSNGKDMVATIDLKQDLPVSSVTVSNCVATGDCIFDARNITVELSLDGKSYKKVASEAYPSPQSHRKEVVRHVLDFTEQQARYVKISASSEKRMPSWSGFSPIPAFVFVDEIAVN